MISPSNRLMRPTGLVSKGLVNSSIGRVSEAGYIRSSRGLPRHPMRILGSFAVVYLIEGSGFYQDANGVRTTVSARELIFVLPDLPHAYGPNPGQSWDEFYIVFSGKVFDAWRELIVSAGPVTPLAPAELWLGRLMGVVEGGSPQDLDQTLDQVCRMQRVLADILKHQRQRALADDDRSFLENARQSLEPPRLGQRVEIPDVASQLGMSYETFRKRFTRLTGVPPGRYVERRRMDRLADLLGDPARKLHEIARRGGFCDEFHFSRRFKQVLGVSPQEFRRQMFGHVQATAAP